MRIQIGHGVEIVEEGLHLLGLAEERGIGLDDAGLVKVTSVKAKRTNVNPRWSPDGGHMVYVEYNRPKFEFNIFRIKADGSGAVNLTKDTKAGASNVGWRCFDDPSTPGPC